MINKSPWCLNAKIAMVKAGINVTELAEKVELSRGFVSGVINGRIVSEKAVNAISDYLNISNSY